MLDDLDAGLLFMRSVDLVQDPAAFLAFKASVNSIFFNGIEGVTAEANHLAVELNLGISLDSGLAVVDFPASFDEGTTRLRQAAIPYRLTSTTS
ncbi:MAG UNVERIFIED_CONTAM: hypothetical protein LVR18_45860 [Planctomycetaceae bacterium]